jgi:hypothetical protein
MMEVTMGWIHSSVGGTGNAYRILMQKPIGKRPLVKLRRCEDNIHAR